MFERPGDWRWGIFWKRCGFYVWPGERALLGSCRSSSVLCTTTAAQQEPARSCERVSHVRGTFLRRVPGSGGSWRYRTKRVGVLGPVSGIRQVSFAMSSWFGFHCVHKWNGATWRLMYPAPCCRGIQHKMTWYRMPLHNKE